MKYIINHSFTKGQANKIQWEIILVNNNQQIAASLEASNL